MNTEPRAVSATHQASEPAEAGSRVLGVRLERWDIRKEGDRIILASRHGDERAVFESWDALERTLEYDFGIMRKRDGRIVLLGGLSTVALLMAFSQWVALGLTRTGWLDPAIHQNTHVFLGALSLLASWVAVPAVIKRLRSMLPPPTELPLDAVQDFGALSPEALEEFRRINGSVLDHPGVQHSRFFVGGIVR